MAEDREKYEKVCICVPPAWVRWFERKAKADGSTLSSFLRRYLTQHAPDFVRFIEEDQNSKIRRQAEAERRQHAR
jgi:hypothetical protein